MPFGRWFTRKANMLLLLYAKGPDLSSFSPALFEYALEAEKLGLSNGAYIVPNGCVLVIESSE
jgi:hypothetical protein